MTTAADLNNPFSSAEFKRVKAVRFTIFDSDTIVGYSVAEVHDVNVYRDGNPIHGGVNDPRLGPIDVRSICETCNCDLKLCPGHWGHVTLARPMYHWGFMKATHNVLRSVCYYCSRMLANPNDLPMKQAMKLVNPKKRLQAVMLCCRAKKRCAVIADDEETMAPPEGEIQEDVGKQFVGGCGYLQPRYFIEATVMMVSFPEGGDEEASGQDRKRPMAADEALNIFRRISDKDIERMGLHPKNNPPSMMILTHLAIPPPHIRPTISMGSMRSEDDVTAKLLDIIKTNHMLKTQVDSGAGEHICLEFMKLLQYHIFTLSDNCIIGIPQATTKSKRPLKGIRERLKSKEGRLRGFLMGKRVDFCARSVIGGDPNLNTEQVGVPRSVALNLTIPERVTPFNLDWLKQMVANGASTWPGAKYIVREDGARVDLRFVSDTAGINLQYGWKVERHMIDGDYIIFNRQPSLHKMSMMGHRAKVMPFSTLRFNLAVTAPYNADFDGDEMNLHLAQSHETRAEIKHIMLNPRQLVSPQGNKPVMGVVQDSLLATAKYTKRDTFLEKDIAMNLLMWLPVWDGQLPIPCILKPKELWTGKQLLSMLLPKSISMKRDSAIASKNKKDEPDFPASDCKVIIQNGELLAGIVCKKTIGASSGSLLHLLWLDDGPEGCRNFLSYLQKLVNQWLTHNGFTCGVADIIANDETLLSVERTLKQAKVEVRAILADAQRGKLETQPGKTMYQSFEAKVNQRLNAAREDAGNIGSSSLDERNNIISMVNAGSKGSPINVAQIIACVGQQNVEGARIRYGFNDRSLPHFTKDDYGAESRGFVENSYLGGLTPQEVWMHAMGGREGVIDTACKTSETGYIQRRLVKSMETLKVHYDGTARNAMNDIIQFLYGEDGMDGLLIEDQTLDIMTYDHQKFEKTFKHEYEKEEYGVGWLPSEVLSEIRASSEQQQILDAEWEKLRSLKEVICKDVFPDGDSKQHIPINITRLIGRAKQRSKQEDMSNVQLRYTPVEIVERVDRLMAELEVTRAIAEGDTIGREVEDNAKIILNAHLRTALGSKKILQAEEMTKQSFDWLLGEVKQRFMKSLAHPGEVIGTLAAQSVGEPATQMTLNTFHFAGVGAKNVTLGVPRLKELINVAKAVKTPSLAVFLNGNLGKDQERAKDVQSMLEHTTLQKVTSFTQIFWDPDPVNTRVMEDKEWVSEYYELPDEDDNPDRCSPWVLRIQLSSKVMTDKKLTVREVGERIIRDFYGDLDCIFTDDNAEELVLRIRLLKEANEMGQEPCPFDPSDDREDKDFKFLRSIEANILKEMTLRGLIGIKKVFMREDTIAAYNESKGKFERSKEWVLDTDGVNMEEVMQLPEVDFTRVQSNDIVEILSVLGIEATRKALLFHVRMVISFDGSYVNYRHLGTLCDVMTQRGHLMAITRHGVNRTNLGPLMKCSFEETVEILMDAAVYNEVDYMRSVSENIIFGQLAPIGTGAMDIHMDDEPDRDEITGARGICALDHATPMLPGAHKQEYFSMASPMGGSGGEMASPLPGATPYQDEVKADFPTTGGSLADLPTPDVTPGEEMGAAMGAERSPFSPMPEISKGFGVSPFSDQGSTASPVGYSPMATELSSPATPSHTPTSPTYSPAVPEDYQASSPHYQPMSPTYSPRSPAYTPTSSGGGVGRSGTSSARSATGSSSPAYAPRTRHGSGTGQSSEPADLKRRTSPAWSPTYSPSTGLAGVNQQGTLYEPTSLLTSPAYTPMSAQYTPTSPMYTSTSPAYAGGASPLTSPKVADIAMESPPAVLTEGDLAGGSPVMQSMPPESPGVPTSPSYTPHQGRATGDHTSEYVRGAAVPSGEGLTDVQDGDAQSSLFEPSDDEQEIEPTYTPPSPGDFVSTAGGTLDGSLATGEGGTVGRSSAASEYVRASTDPAISLGVGPGRAASSSTRRAGRAQAAQPFSSTPAGTAPAYSPTEPGDAALD
uniref:DNA-directed RNA polymerase subunit n=1 Tax=Alexandrium monilatum TaxID=311494 RepID=A0A7S4QTQ4_9DINO